MPKLELANSLKTATRPKHIAVLEACWIGLGAGLAAVAVKQGVGMLGALRLDLAALYSAPIVLPLFGLIGGLLAGFLVERVAPETSGSGIPQVKALLQGAQVRFDLRIVWVKLLGGVYALGSGFLLGREGPTVQVGAALAAQFERWFPTSPAQRRQLISAGAGAGLAAAFNAPVAGVLFVVEELLKDVSGFTLGTAILASFMAAVISEAFGGRAFDLNLATDLPPSSFTAMEIPFYVLLGVAAGVLGSLFNKSILVSLTLNYHKSRLPLSVRVGLAGLASGAIVSALPTVFHDNAGLRHLLISGHSPWQTAACAFALQFVLTVIGYGSGAPGGLFAPTLMLGAALGYLTGIAAHHVLGTGDPAAFALVGMGAFFSGAIRVPITAVVIVFEMSGQFALVLPLMVACAIAWFVGERLAPGPLYDRLVDWAGLVPKQAEQVERPQPSASALTAADVLTEDYEALTSTTTLGEAIAALCRLESRECLVVDDGKLVGVVTDCTLLACTRQPLPDSTPLSEIVTACATTASLSMPLAEVLLLLSLENATLIPVTDGARILGVVTLADAIHPTLAGADNEAPQPSQENTRQ